MEPFLCPRRFTYGIMFYLRETLDYHSDIAKS